MQSIHIEGLENRIAFDGSGSISLSAGVLTIIGTQERDIVFVSVVSNSTLDPTPVTPSGTTLLVDLNETIQQLDPDSVRHIHIMTGDGDDDIHFFEDGAPRRRIQPSIDAGAGHDTITIGKNTAAGPISGGVDSDLIIFLQRRAALVSKQDAVLFVLPDGLISVRGTDGNDSIQITDVATLDAPSELEAIINGQSYSWNPHPHSRVLISAGAGDDTINLSNSTTPNNGAPSMFYLGTSKPATLIGGFGNDIINAGSGNTVLIGGRGDDILTGNIGHDVFFGSPGQDVINH